VQQDETIQRGEQPLARERGADLAAFYDRRAAAALAYCSRLCTPTAIADAVEAAFARVFEASAAGEATDEAALERRLRSAVRSEAARRASTSGSGVPARRLLERLADPNRGGACELMPALLAARADGALSGRDLERMQTHLRRCGDCRLAEQRFDDAERAFDALSGDEAPALGRSLLAEMLSDAPLSDRRRFARERLAAEPPDWLEEIGWDDASPPAEARVVEVPDDALDEIAPRADPVDEVIPAEPGALDEIAAEPDDALDEIAAEPGDALDEMAPAEPEHELVDEDHELVEPNRTAAGDEFHDAPGDELDDVPDAEVVDEAAPEPRARGTTAPERRARAIPAPEPLSQTTAEHPAPRRPRLGARARRRIAITLLVLGVLLLAEAAVTVIWKEPLTAYLASRAQDDLTSQLHKLDASAGGISADDAKRLAGIHNVDARTKARMAVLARHERATVPPGDALGLLTIGKINSEAVVVQGEDGASLRKGPAHYLDTALPGEGRVVGIAGHRTTYGAWFRHIDDLARGDTITLKMPYGLFTYTVDRHRIVPAGFTGAFDISGGGSSGGAGSTGGEWLVLSACHPLYSASERILVYARLTDVQPLGAAVDTSATPTTPTSREQALARRRARLKAMGTRTLTVGMTGSDVKEVQRLLGLPATGTFGPETQAAVLEFQRSHGLPPVGQVGSQTKAALARRPHPPSRPPTPPAVPPQKPQSTSATPTQQTPTQPQQQTYGQPPTSGTGTTQQPYSNP
jgi:sortase A